MDLQKLPPALRAALRRRLEDGEPTPILSRTRPLDRLAAAVLFLGGTVALGLVRFIDLGVPSHVARYGGVLSTALGAVALFGLGLFIRSALHQGFVRFRQGTFVYPLDLLVIDGTRMRVRSFGDARFVSAEGSVLEIEYANGEKLRVRGRRHTKEPLFAEMLDAQRELEDASVQGKSTDDVLSTLRDHFPWSDFAPNTGPAPRRTALVAAFTLLGAALGAGAWAVRPVEEDGLAAARPKTDVESCRAYASPGQPYENEACVALEKARDDAVALTKMIADYPRTRAATIAEVHLREVCAARARDFHRDRCPSGFDQSAGSGPCPPAEAELICAAEVKVEDHDCIMRAVDLQMLFIDRRREVRGQRPQNVADIDARIEILIHQADASICAVGPPADDLRALHELARTQKRPVRLVIQYGGVVVPEVFLRQIADDAIDIDSLATGVGPTTGDWYWTFNTTATSLEFVSGPTPSDRSRVARVPFDAGTGWLVSLEQLGLRPNGPTPERCVVPSRHPVPTRGHAVSPFGPHAGGIH